MFLAKVLKESFRFLFRHPGFFLPRLIVITLWNTIYLALIEGFRTFSQTLDIQMLFNLVWTWLPWAIISNQLSIITHSMYPPLTRDLKETGKFRMWNALKIAIIRWPQTFIVYLVPTVAATVLIVPLGVLAAIGLLKGNAFFIGVGVGLSFLVLTISVIIFYFAPSKVVLEKGSGVSTLKSSVKLTKSHIKEATILTLFSFGVFFVAVFLEGSLKSLGLIGFWVGRYVGSIFGTYSFVVNADLYLEVKKSHHS